MLFCCGIKSRLFDFMFVSPWFDLVFSYHFHMHITICISFVKYIFAFLTYFAIFSIFLLFYKNSVNTNKINSIVMLLFYILQIFCNLPFNFWG